VLRPALLSLADSTLRQGQRHFRLFASWCRVHGCDCVPASREAVALFLADMADRYRPSSLAAFLHAIALAHRAARKPFDSRLFTPILHGIRRAHGGMPRGPVPITLGELRGMVGTLPDTIVGVRNRALLLVGFAGALRRSELIGLDLGVQTQGGTGSVEIEQGGARIILRRSKSDQVGHGLTKWLPRGCSPCPVEALEEWLRRAPITSGPIFRRVYDGLAPKRLHINAVGEVVRRAMHRAALHGGANEEQARLRAAQVTSHSLRAGFVRSAVLAGVPSEDIAIHVGWKSTELVFHYAGQLDPFQDNPAQLVLGL
jgi:integrase